VIENAITTKFDFKNELGGGMLLVFLEKCWMSRILGRGSCDFMICKPKSAFTLGVSRDSKVESSNTMPTHLGLKPNYHEKLYYVLS